MRDITAISTWDDICFPVSSKSLSDLLSEDYEVTPLRSQVVVVEPPTLVTYSGELRPSKPVITAVQSSEYEVIPNSLIRDVSNRVLSRAGLKHSVKGWMMGYADFRFQIIIEGKPIAIGNPNDTITAAINLSNNYTATGNLTISGRTVQEKSVHYAEQYETIPSFSVYRQICTNGLWGWSNVSELEYLSALARGEKVNTGSRRKRVSRRMIESPLEELVEGEEIIKEVQEQTVLAQHMKRIRHTRGAAENMERLLEGILRDILSQYDRFAQSPVIRIYNDLYERKVENFGARLNEVIEATSRTVIPRNLLPIVTERIVTEMRDLKEPVANDWLVYNAFNYAIWNSPAKQHLNRRETAEAAVLHFLVEN